MTEGLQPVRQRKPRSIPRRQVSRDGVYVGVLPVLWYGNATWGH